MEYYAPLTLLIFVFSIFCTIIFKFKSSELLQLFDGDKSILIICLFMFSVLCASYFYKESAWIADLLKVVVGIVVGYTTAKGNKLFKGTGVDASGTKFGDYAKLAGRDINETIEKMSGNIEQLKDSVINQYSQIADIAKNGHIIAGMIPEYLFYSCFDSEAEPLNEIAKVARELHENGWRFETFSNFFDGKHGYTALFHRLRAPEDNDIPMYENFYKVRFYHGREQRELDY